MSKKKKIQQLEDVVTNDEPREKPVEVIKESQKTESVYLRETLFTLPEIKAYGLNLFFLRAILKDKCYTLSDAHRLIRSVVHRG